MRIQRCMMLAAFCACAGAAPQGTTRHPASDALLDSSARADRARVDSLCVVEGSELASVAATITSTGDTLVGGSPYGSVHPTTAPSYAGATEWFASGRPIVFRGSLHAMERLPLHVGRAYLQHMGEYRGTPVFVLKARPGHPIPDLLFLPVRPGCIFQMVQSRGSR